MRPSETNAAHRAQIQGHRAAQFQARTKEHLNMFSWGKLIGMCGWALTQHTGTFIPESSSFGVFDSHCLDGTHVQLPHSRPPWRPPCMQPAPRQGYSGHRQSPEGTITARWSALRPFHRRLFKHRWPPPTGQLLTQCSVGKWPGLGVKHGSVCVSQGPPGVLQRGPGFCESRRGCCLLLLEPCRAHGGGLELAKAPQAAGSRACC